jgi:hypothetical protein
MTTRPLSGKPTGEISRRHFLAGSTTGIAALNAAARADDPTAAETIAFFVIGDTHFLASEDKPPRLDERSAVVTGRLVDRLNRLVGTEIPAPAGEGVVRRPFGVIHAGDIIDTGDKTGSGPAEMQRTEMAAFERACGLTGDDGDLDFPLYEVHGNHDGPAGKGIAVERIIERTKTRPRVQHVSANGLHYSWDVGPVHFVNLGIVVGAVPGITRRRRYAPLESLDFLVKDLADHVILRTCRASTAHSRATTCGGFFMATRMPGPSGGGTDRSVVPRGNERPTRSRQRPLGTSMSSTLTMRRIFPVGSRLSSTSNSVRLG